MSDYFEEGAAPLVESPTSVVDEAVELYEGGEDPALIAAALRDQYGPTHEKAFVQAWHAAEQEWAPEPEPLTAAEYVAQQQHQARLDAAVTEYRARQDAEAAQAAAAQQHAEQTAQTIEQFVARHPGATKPEIVAEMTRLGSQLRDDPTWRPTGEDAGLVLETLYRSAEQVEVARRKAAIEHEMWHDTSNVVNDEWLGAPKTAKPTMDELVQKNLAEAQRNQPDKFFPQPSRVEAIRAEFDGAIDAPQFHNLDVVAGRKPGELVKENFVGVDDFDPGRDADGASLDHQRQQMIKEGWKIT